MNDNELEGIFAFINQAENLKNTLRHAFTSTGKQESAAEHSWRLCLLIMACAGRFPHLSLEKLLKLAVIHDLPEAVCGDTPAPKQGDHQEKTALERAGLARLTASLPPPLQRELTALWEEYEAASTEEAKCVKALDKIETLMQHNQGKNPPDFDYAFNLGYATAATDADKTAAELRSLVDAGTRSRMQ